jgi:hypothetical protein
VLPSNLASSFSLPTFILIVLSDLLFPINLSYGSFLILA